MPLPSGGSLGRIRRLPRYYEHATTTCFPSCFTSFPSFGSTTIHPPVRISTSPPNVKKLWPGLFRGALGRPRPLSLVEVAGPPRFPVNPLYLCPALGPRRNLCISRYRCFGAAPTLKNVKGFRSMMLSRLNYTASVLTVYASCR